MRQIIQARKARLLLLILISTLLFVACNDGENANLTLTETVEAALATEVANQKTELPTATKTLTPTVTETPLPTATSTITPTASVTSTLTPTLWYVRPESSTPDAKLQYGYVNDVPVLLYTSAEEAAVNGEKLRTLPGDEVYVSYRNTAEIEGILYAEVEPGGWISLSSVEPYQPSTFSGVEINKFPDNGFGWTTDVVLSLSKVPSKDEPDQVINVYERYQPFPVLSVEVGKDQQRWFEIKPGEWVSDEDFAYVDNIVANPSHSTGGRWISVNLSEQYLILYENEQPIYATLVSTGNETNGWATGTGIFTVYHKDETNSLLSPDPKGIGNYLIQDVPHILYYQGSWALHGAYWHDNFGTPSSHGCVNLSPADAEWVFNWAMEGEWVVLYRD